MSPNKKACSQNTPCDAAAKGLRSFARLQPECKCYKSVRVLEYCLAWWGANNLYALIISNMWTLKLKYICQVRKKLGGTLNYSEMDGGRNYILIRNLNWGEYCLCWKDTNIYGHACISLCVYTSTVRYNSWLPHNSTIIQPLATP